MLDRELKSFSPALMPRSDGAPAGWAVSTAPVDYPVAVAAMHERVQSILEGRAGELIWLPRPATCSIPVVFLFSRASGAASSPITAPASEWPTSCWICAIGDEMCVVWSRL